MKRSQTLISSVVVSLATILCGSSFAFAADKPSHGGTCCEGNNYSFEVSQKRTGDDVAFSVWIKDGSSKPVEDGALSLEILLDKAKKTEYVSSYNGKDGAWHALGVLPNKGQNYPITLDYSKKGEKTPSVKAEVALKI